MSREVRKTVSVVFSDVVSSTRLGEQLDLESLRRVMTRYFDTASAVHQRHGGLVEKFIGDAVMAVFGIPDAHEDDALWAVRAAAELRDALAGLNQELERDLGVTLAVRTGVNTGLVLAGDGHRGDAFVSGDAVNVAARLERAADAGAILVGEATWRLVADAVQVEPVTPFVPRGKTAPVMAYRLAGVTPDTPGHARRFDTPVVGRERELAALGHAFDRAGAGAGCQLVTVLGDAGVGKTRLLRAFADRLGKRAVVLYASCPAYGEDAGGKLVGRLTCQAAGAAGAADQAAGATWTADQTVGVAGQAAPAARAAASAGPQAAFRALRALLEAAALRRPVVVLLDDLHWADSVALDLVEYLHAFARDARLVLVVGARPQLLEQRPCWTAGQAGATLTLEPLDAAEADELLVGLLAPDTLDPVVRAGVAAWAEGNPLFIEELLRWLVEQGRLHREQGRWMAHGRLDELPVPPAVEALIGAELDRLAPEERVVVETASVAGQVFDWAAVAAVIPAPLRQHVGRHLLALARRRFIRVVGGEAGSDAFTFRHRLLHDAAYASVPRHERAVAHLRVAEWLSAAAGGRTAADDGAVDHHLEQAYRCLAWLGWDELPPVARGEPRAL